MYVREFSPPVSAPVSKGAPIYGTWDRAFDDINLIHLAKSFPLPLFNAKNRLKEWQSFNASNEMWHISGLIMDLKRVRIAHCTLWDLENKRLLSYKKTLPYGSWRLPRSLSNSSITSKSLGFYLRIHNWLDADLIEIDIDIKGKKNREGFTGHLEFDFRQSGTRPFTTCQRLVNDSCMYSSKMYSQVKGDFVFNGRHITMQPQESGGIFCDYKAFLPYISSLIWARCHGRTQEGLPWAFSISESPSHADCVHGDQVLWFDKQAYALPAIRITRAGEDENADWVIQDTEGMVDLTFSPRLMENFQIRRPAIRTNYSSPRGVYNGTLVAPTGDKVNIRNAEGILENLIIRG